jgi:hypothetical protein
MPTAQRVNPTDLGARKAAEGEAAKIEAAEEQERIATARAVEDEQLSNEVLDLSYSGGLRAEPLPVREEVIEVAPTPDTDDEILRLVESGEATPDIISKLLNRFRQQKQVIESTAAMESGIRVVEDGKAVVRLLHNVPDMTYGPITYPEDQLKAGRLVKLPVEVARWLDQQGYVWH